MADHLQSEQPESTEEVDPLQVRLAQAGDALAREAIFAATWPVCYRVARRVTRSDDDARDVVQDAFVKALKNLERFDHRSAFRTWLLRIVSNCATDHLRRNRRRSLLFSLTSWASVDRNGPDEPGQLADPAKRLEQQDLRLEIDNALGNLSETTRGAFVLYAEAGMTYQEVADTLSVPIGTVMSRIHSARKKLQTCVREADKPSPPHKGDAQAQREPAGHTNQTQTAESIHHDKFLAQRLSLRVARNPS